MKKILLLDESERKAFLNYCDTIKNMENDKDIFLEASKPEKHESKQTDKKINMSLVIISCSVIISCVALNCCTFKERSSNMAYDKSGKLLPDGISLRKDGRYQARYTFNGKRYTTIR